VITRCPHCDTWFRVQAGQLQAARGQVRCGECDHPFDALAELRDEPPPVSHAPAEDPAPLPARHAPSPAGILWILGALVLGLILVLQVLWWQRERLAATPNGWPWARALCRVLPCEARPPRRPDRIEVIGRSLTPDPAHPGTLRFHLEIANRARMPQPWPRIDLVLSDQRAAPLGGLRLSPKDYLTPDAPEWFAPGHSLEVRRRIADTRPPSRGFHIEFH